MFSHEEMCTAPEEIYCKVIDKINQFPNLPIETPYKGEMQFDSSNPKKGFDDKKIKKAYQYFVDNYGDLYFTL